MASDINGNPMRVEGAATIWSGPLKRVRLIQWIDDAGDIVNDSTLVLTINGTALTVKLQMLADISNHGVVVWQMGPFSPGIAVTEFISTTQATGQVHIWID